MAKSFASPSLDGLVDLACRDGVDIRPTLLRVLTDLYLQKPSHSSEEEVQYVELAQRLIEAVDSPTRAIVAAHLGKYAAAPSAVMKSLAAMGTLVSAEPFVQTPAEPDPGPDLIELFFSASTGERRLILINLDAAAAGTMQRTPFAAPDTARKLELAALQHNMVEFSRVLERSLDLGHSLAERMVHDSSGEPVVVAAKALGMEAGMLQRILLFLNPTIGQSVKRVYALAALFDEITMTAAIHMLTIWRQAVPGSQPIHEPVYTDDERLRVRTLATLGRHRTVSTQDLLPARVTITG